MDKKLIVSPSPHVHGAFSTQRLMLDVLVALLPAFAVSVWVFGLSALIVTAVSVAGCVLFEYLIQKFMLRGPLTVWNLSAVVTGVLLAFNLPANIPLWLVVLGAFVAIAIGKMTFGGLGKNPFNPALGLLRCHLGSHSARLCQGGAEKRQFGERHCAEPFYAVARNGYGVRLAG